MVVNVYVVLVVVYDAIVCLGGRRGYVSGARGAYSSVYGYSNLDYGWWVD